MPSAHLRPASHLLTLPTRAVAAAGAVFAPLRRRCRRHEEEAKLAAVRSATARVLHQINNPLQTILLHADLLQDERMAADPASRRQICDAIVGEAVRLTEMLAGLSLYSAGGARVLSLKPVAIHELVRELAGSSSPRIPRVEVGRIEEAVVRADDRYLRQALTSLIANARTALEGIPDPRLTLSVVREGRMVVIGVDDNGPGIPRRIAAGVFQPFVSGTNRGMGLGLTICKEIVEGHGGRVRVESRAGTGTRFRVELPAYAPDEPTLPLAEPGR